MKTQDQVQNWIEKAVNKRYTSPENPYGAQCVELVNHYSQWLGYGKIQWVDARSIFDLRRNGYVAVPYRPGVKGKLGDIIVWDKWPKNKYGHTGIFISGKGDVFYSLDQNFAVFNENHGSPAVIVPHRYSDYPIRGFLRPTILTQAVKLKEEEMITLRGLKMIFHLRFNGEKPDQSAIQKFVGKWSFDEVDNHVMKSTKYKNYKKKYKDAIQVINNQFPGEFK